jgi:hypothetical protein
MRLQGVVPYREDFSFALPSIVVKYEDKLGCYPARKHEQIAKEFCKISHDLLVICSSRQFIMEIPLDLDDFVL